MKILNIFSRTISPRGRERNQSPKIFHWYIFFSKSYSNLSSLTTFRNEIKIFLTISTPLLPPPDNIKRKKSPKMKKKISTFFMKSTFKKFLLYKKKKMKKTITPRDIVDFPAIFYTCSSGVIFYGFICKNRRNISKLHFSQDEVIYCSFFDNFSTFSSNKTIGLVNTSRII